MYSCCQVHSFRWNITPFATDMNIVGRPYHVTKALAEENDALFSEHPPVGLERKLFSSRIFAIHNIHVFLTEEFLCLKLIIVVLLAHRQKILKLFLTDVFPKLNDSVPDKFVFL